MLLHSLALVAQLQSTLVPLPPAVVLVLLLPVVLPVMLLPVLLPALLAVLLPMLLLTVVLPVLLVLLMLPLVVLTELLDVTVVLLVAVETVVSGDPLVDEIALVLPGVVDRHPLMTRKGYMLVSYCRKAPESTTLAAWSRALKLEEKTATPRSPPSPSKR